MWPGGNGEKKMSVTYTLQTHNGKKIGSLTYLNLSVAIASAKRIAGKHRKNPELRGGFIQIVSDDGSIYGQKVVQRFDT